MSSIFEKINSKNFNINNGVVYIDSKAVGLVLPSALEGFKGDKLLVSGSKGVVLINDKDSELNIVNALIESGSIIFESSNEIVNQTYNNLVDPLFSRTSSYLLGCVKNCDEFLISMDKIVNSSVVIIGCGGIGSLTALTLIGAGLRNITLIDDDKIEESNLNRQLLWTRSDIGQYKVNILFQVIKDRFPNVNCELIIKKIHDADIMDLCNKKDLIILTADEPLGIGNEGIDSIDAKSRPKVISCGYTHSILTVNYNNQSNETFTKKDTFWRRNPYFIGPSFGPSNIELAGVISSLAIHEIAFNKLHKTDYISFWDSKVFPREFMNE
ncbi:ThiF family adenylyltransferase [Acinetobacter puyangensis]|uniref:ThiF family adenylyltransferase n=1 Tax=Acinetobacter puyangensis TaxID=1096779 RepID=UPI003A4E13AF